MERLFTKRLRLLTTVRDTAMHMTSLADIEVAYVAVTRYEFDLLLRAITRLIDFEGEQESV